MLLMRTRKPWVRLRFRLLGWKVRFMASLSPVPVGTPDRVLATGNFEFTESARALSNAGPERARTTLSDEGPV